MPAVPPIDKFHDTIESIDTKKALKERNPLDDLLPKQRKFLKLFLKTRNRTRAWRLSHKNCKSDAAAYVGASKFLQDHPEVIDWLYSLAGIGDDDMVSVIRDSFSATRLVPVKGGAPLVEKDHFARLKGVEVGMKLRGKGEGGKGVGNTMNIQIISDKQAGVFKIIEGEEVDGSGGETGAG